MQPPFPLAGEVAALGTACCWVASSMSFTAAGRRVGSLAVNLIRLLMALVLLAALNGVLRGHPFPTDATQQAWLWLSLSGLVGFTFGDLCLFRAFVVIGPRLSMLVFSTVPLMTTLAGWAILGETLALKHAVGMALTMGGVAWVVLERTQLQDGEARKRIPLTGVLLALGGAAGQALGLVLSKLGMGDYDPFAATQIRVIAGTVGFAILFLVLGWWPRALAALRHGKAMAYTALGAFSGPFLGVSLSMVAVKYTLTGVAATLMSLVPVLIILPSVWLFRERVSARAVIGAFVATGGSALLFL